MNLPPIDHLSPEADKLLVDWSRDLSVCTEEELRDRWTGDELKAIDRLDPIGFEARVTDHSFIYYVAQRLFFADVIDDPAFLYTPFHRDMICRPIERYALAPSRRDRILVLLAQRESFKSTFQHGATPVALTLRDYLINSRHARVCLQHQKLDLAQHNLVRVKERCFNSKWFEKVWWEFYSPNDLGTKDAFDWPCLPPGKFSENSMQAASLDTDLTGKHFDWFLCSDLVTPEQRYSKTLRNQTLRKFSSVKYTLDTKNGRLMLDGTLYHPADLNSKQSTAKAKDGSLLHEVVKIGAGGKRAGKPLTLPFRHSEEFLEADRADQIATTGTDDLWWLQMQNEIRASSTIATDMSWLRYCTQKDVGIDSWRVIVVDPAWKGTPNAGEGDSASIQVWALEKRGNLLLKFLMDGVHSNMMTDADGKAEIFRLARQYFVMDVAPEERGGYAFRQALSNEAATRGQFLNVIKLKSMQVNKAWRITSFLGDVQSGRVFICEECDPVLRLAFESQFESFPQCMDDEDDAIDCAAYTSDQAVAEAYMPKFNFAALPPLHDQMMYQPRTKYCAN